MLCVYQRDKARPPEWLTGSDDDNDDANITRAVQIEKTTRAAASASTAKSLIALICLNPFHRKHVAIREKNSEKFLPKQTHSRRHCVTETQKRKNANQMNWPPDTGKRASWFDTFPNQKSLIDMFKLLDVAPSRSNQRDRLNESQLKQNKRNAKLSLLLDKRHLKFSLKIDSSPY